MQEPRHVRTTLGVLFIAADLSCLWNLRPFPAADLSTMLVVATWPVLTWAQNRLGADAAWL
jgi:hypothetical protein